MLLGAHIRNFALLSDFSFGVTYEQLLPLADFDTDDGNPAVAAAVAPESLHSKASTTAEKVLPPAAAKAAAERETFPLHRISAIIGRSNSGKTLLFEALDFLADCLRFSVPYASNLHDRGGFKCLQTAGITGPMRFDCCCLAPWHDEILHYGIELGVDRHGRPYVIQEEAAALPINAAIRKCLPRHESKLAEKPARPVLCLEMKEGLVKVSRGNIAEQMELTDSKCPALATFGRIMQYKRLRALYQFLSGIFLVRLHSDGERQRSGGGLQSGGHRHLDAYGTNVRNVLRYLKQEDPQEFRRISRKIDEHMPRSQRLDDRALDRGITNSEVKLFTLLLLLQDPRPRPLIMLENPDEGLHHEMVEHLCAAFREYSLRREDVQLLFSTHSALLLESLSPPEVWVLKRPPLARHSCLQSLEDSAPVGREDSPTELMMGSGHEGEAETEREGGTRSAGTPLRMPAPPREDAIFPGSRAVCIASSPTVCAMYREGVGLGALWYAGHFDADEEP